MSNKNPRSIDIVWEDGRGTIENVDTWWYDGTDLIVQSLDGSKKTYPATNVVD